MISEKKAAIVNNVLITMAGKYGEYALALLSSVIVARALGPSTYGVYAYTIFICGWMIRLSSISLLTTTIRFVAESRGQNRPEVSERIAGGLLRRQSIVALILCTLLLILVQFYKPEVLREQSLWFFVLICLAVLAKSRYRFIISIAKGFERFDVEAIAAIVVGLFTTLSMLYLWYAGGSLSGFLVIFVLSSTGLWLMASTLCRRRNIRYRGGSIDTETQQRIDNYRRLTLLFGVVGIMGGRSIETFLLGEHGSSSDIGYLGLSLALTQGLRDLGTAGLTTVLMPSLAYSFGESNLGSVRRIFLESTRFYISFGIGLGLSGLLIARPIILLLYGQQYIDAMWVLSAYLLISGLGLSSAAVGAYLSTTDRQDLRLKFSIAVLTTNVILALSLVPLYGLKGVVASSALTTLFGGVLGFQWVVRNLGATIPFGLYARLLLSGLLALAVSYGLASAIDSVFADIVAVVLFAILYVVISIRLQCWTRQDLDLLRHVHGLLPGPLNRSLLSLYRKLRT